MTDDEPREPAPENDLGELLRAVLYERPYAIRHFNPLLRIAFDRRYVVRKSAENWPRTWVVLGRDLTLTAAGLEALQEPDEEP